MKRVLLWSSAVVALAVIAVAATASTLFATARTSTVGELTFRNELKIPPLLEPREEEGRKVFELTLQAGRAELIPGKVAETWEANGAYLGPTLRAERGDRVECASATSVPSPLRSTGTGCTCPQLPTAGRTRRSSPG